MLLDLDLVDDALDGVDLRLGQGDNSDDGDDPFDEPGAEAEAARVDDSDAYESDSSFYDAEDGLSPGAGSEYLRRLDFNIDRHAVLQWVQDPAIDDRDRLARRIVCITRLGLVACASHGRRTVGGGLDRAQGLSEFTAATRDIMERHESARLLGLHRRDPIGNIDLFKNKRINIIPRVDLRNLACGLETSGEYRSVDLENDNQHNIDLSQTRFDIDSFIQVVPSITSFKHPIKYTPVPQRGNMIASSIHVRHVVTVDGKETKVALHKIPHISFGTTQGAPIYLFFPNLYQEVQERASTMGGHTQLTEDEYRFIYDKVIYPALLRVLSVPEQGHIPSCYNDAVDIAKQSRGHKDAEQTGRLPAFGFDISSNHLGRLGDLLDAYGPEELSFCDGMFFVLDQKNTKLTYGGQRSASVCVEQFWEKQSSIVDEDDADIPNIATPQLIDLGAEWAPSQGNCNALVLLARRCCQRNTLRFLYGQDIEWTLLGSLGPDEALEPEDNVRGGSHYEYHINHLRDTCSLTSEPYGDLLRQGLYYYQSYTAGKERILNLSRNPYSAKELLQGGWNDSGLGKVFKNGLGPRENRRVIDAELRACNDLILKRTERGKTLHACWRGEWRCSSQLARRVGHADALWIQHDTFGQRSKVQFYTDHHGGRRGVRTCSSAFYAIHSKTYWEFVRGMIAVYVLFLDLISVSAQRTISTVPRAALLYASFVTLLKTFINPIGPRFQGALSNPTRINSPPMASDDGRPVRKGLGISALMERYGFGFLPVNVADWMDLRIHEDLTTGLSLPGYITSIGKRSYDEIQDQPETLFDTLRELVRMHWRDPNKVSMACKLSSYLMLRSYRRYALNKICLHVDIPDAQRVKVEGDNVPFDFTSLKDFAGECGLLLVFAGNNRTRYRNLEDLYQFTWGELLKQAGQGGGKKKFLGSSFRSESWRIWYQSMLDTIAYEERAHGRMGSPITPRWFEEHHKANFFTHHSAFPFPAEDGIIKTKDHSSVKARCLLCTRLRSINERGAIPFLDTQRKGGQYCMATAEGQVRKSGWEMPREFRNIWTVAQLREMVEGCRTMQV
ncbi:hypothetical protein CSIM01_13837 [Colletotrichum simmondsii]|uniref:Uncharacterized protein n=1 Tax=Colletotrichum simmondsii TaxID=703756 RepID=A0A135RQ87_9PEZI|nr:hypothetical protein CSIM01_13837 [Colletotrichum simmondsii]